MYKLALELRVPVSVIREMCYDEYVKWFAFFDMEPPGLREDLRAYRIMQAMGTKEKGEQIFESIAAIKKREAELAAKRQEGELNMSKFSKSFLFAQLATAKGGDKLNVLEDSK